MVAGRHGTKAVVESLHLNPQPGDRQTGIQTYRLTNTHTLGQAVCDGLSETSKCPCSKSHLLQRSHLLILRETNTQIYKTMGNLLLQTNIYIYISHYIC